MARAPKETPAKSDAFVANDATLRGCVGYHMKRAFNVIQADLAITLRPLDLRMLTFSALVLIRDNAGLSQSQLADAMDVERPNLVVIIDELEQRDLIVRERVPTDRRAYALSVTLRGQSLCARAVAAVQAHEAALLHGVDAQTQELVVQALGIIQRQKPQTVP